MDYLQGLKFTMTALQRKIRLLQDLRFFLENAEGDDLVLFGDELRKIETTRGVSVGELLASILKESGTGGFAPPVVGLPANAIAERPAPQAGTDKRTAIPSGADARAAISSGADSRQSAFPRESAALREARSLIESCLRDIPAGAFVMGSDEDETERPAHTVTLGAYKLCDHLITCTEYALFLADNPGWAKDRADPELRDEHYLEDWGREGFPEGKGDHPVAYVSFFAAQAFASWIGLRLPTEAEWERASRGGLVGKKFPNGDQMNETLANFAKKRRGTTSVRSYEPNGYGLYDMAGNLFEWTADWFGPYSPGETVDPRGPVDGEYKVVRGGSWMSGATTLRVSARFDMDPRACSQVGIRLAR